MYPSVKWTLQIRPFFPKAITHTINATSLLLKLALICTWTYLLALCRAGGIGPAAPVLAGPVFSQGKSKIPFLQKASNKQSASVILGLIRLTIKL